MDGPSGERSPDSLGVEAGRLRLIIAGHERSIQNRSESLRVEELTELMARFPRPGRIEWIGLRPSRGNPMHVVDWAVARAGCGLEGDRYDGRSGKRGVTLIQHEHLAALAGLLGREAPGPGLLRRNLVISGINLIALKGCQFAVGDVILEGTGLCHPCSRMERALGPGGFNAMRGHGGLCARIVRGGTIRVGDSVVAVADGDSRAGAEV